MPTEILTDDLDQFSWSMKTIVTDEAGVVQSTTIDYDNGNSYAEVFDEAMSQRTSTYYDFADLALFTEKSTTRYVDQATGENLPFIVSERRVFDDGRTEDHNYLTNMRVLTDENDVMPWSRVEQKFHQGDADPYLSSTYFDDGSSKTETVLFETDGTSKPRATTLRNQNGEVTERWAYSYDVNGELYFEEYINVTNQTERYVNYRDGKLFGITKVNGEGHPSLWESRTVHYDDDGAMVYRKTKYVDGVQREETFEAGRLTKFEEIDLQSVTPWYRFTTHYDEEGAISTRQIIYDDNVERTDTYEEGALVQRIDHDGFGGRSWYERRSFFDETGNLARREIDSDNGISTTDYYVDGQRRVTQKTDTGDVKSWDTILRNYDTFGDLLTVETTYDDGDVHVLVGEDNSRVLFDGNDSHSWAFKVTTFDQDNAKTVTTYDNYLELPAEFAELFEFY